MTDQTETLRQLGREIELAPGEVLCRQDSTSDGLYYLERGRLGVYKEEQDDTYLLSEIVPGGLVGEVGAATGWLRTATVKALTQTHVLTLHKSDFDRLVVSHLYVSHGLERETSRRMIDLQRAAEAA